MDKINFLVNEFVQDQPVDIQINENVIQTESSDEDNVVQDITVQ